MISLGSFSSPDRPSFSGTSAGRTSSFGYGSLGGGKAPSGGVMQASAPSAGGGKSLNANQSWNTGGIAGPMVKNIAGRVGNFVQGQMSGGGMPGMGGGGAGGAAGGEAGAAEGIGAVAEEAAPLLLAA